MWFLIVEVRTREISARGTVTVIKAPYTPVSTARGGGASSFLGGMLSSLRLLARSKSFDSQHVPSVTYRHQPHSIAISHTPSPSATRSFPAGDKTFRYGNLISCCLSGFVRQPQGVDRPPGMLTRQCAVSSISASFPLDAPEPQALRSVTTCSIAQPARSDPAHLLQLDSEPNASASAIIIGRRRAMLGVAVTATSGLWSAGIRPRRSMAAAAAAGGGELQTATNGLAWRETLEGSGPAPVKGSLIR